MQRVKKFVKEWGLTLLLLVILLVPSWRLTVASWLQGAVLKTGLFRPKVEETSLQLNAGDYTVVLESPEGNRIRLSQWQENTLFINFWATWCAPCLAEMPDLEALYHELQHEPQLIFAFISTDDDWHKAQAYMKKKGYQMPLYRIVGGASELFRPTTLPTTLVIDGKGTVLVNRQGMAQYHTRDFIDFLTNQIPSE